MKILITGTAGFIGSHLAEKMLDEGYEIIGLDNINNYYDIYLKYARLDKAGVEINIIDYNKKIKSKKYLNYDFIKLNLEDKENISNLFKKERFDCVINLAAQAGVRYSLENPYAYINSNILGFINILEGCRHNNVKHLLYASSSSVYGSNKKLPFSVEDNVDHPISLYAATKKSNELMAYTYSHLFNFQTTGLRFFTVYGPWGRPDMALFIFTKKILQGESIDVFNNGNMKRDFTYIDDIVEGISRLLKITNDKYNVFNIGNNNPIDLMNFIKIIENYLCKKASLNYLPMQPGDVNSTFADIDSLIKIIDFKPTTKIETGIKMFLDWYCCFYNDDKIRENIIKKLNVKP